MKRIFPILLIIGFILSGCVPSNPPFRQAVTNISYIELINNSNEDNRILLTLSDTEAVHFMNDLLKLQCYKRLQPIGYFSDMEIRIYYLNGDVDIIGTSANGYIEQGEMCVSGWYYYKEDELATLFASYAG